MVLSISSFRRRTTPTSDCSVLADQEILHCNHAATCNCFWILKRRYTLRIYAGCWQSLFARRHTCALYSAENKIVASKRHWALYENYKGLNITVAIFLEAALILESSNVGRALSFPWTVGKSNSVFAFLFLARNGAACSRP